MRSRVGTTLALLVCVALTACTGDGGEARPSPGPTSLAVEPQPPHASGRMHVRLQPGLTAMTDDECRPGEERRVCSADGTQSWAPIEEPAAATLVDARTHLAGGHTSWTVVLRFAPGSHASLQRAARDAAATGGVVLVMPDERVLAAVPAPDVRGTSAVITGLDKPTAWDLVAAFDAL